MVFCGKGRPFFPPHQTPLVGARETIEGAASEARVSAHNQRDGGGLSELMITDMSEMTTNERIRMNMIDRNLG